MPSQYRSQGLASVQMHTQFSSYAMPCTPQAHCRYEPAALFSPLMSFQDCTESWFPAAAGAFETTTRNGSPQDNYLQQVPSELPMSDDHDSLTDIRSETTTWSNCARDNMNVQPGPCSVDVKPTMTTAVHFNPVTVATTTTAAAVTEVVDLNATPPVVLQRQPTRKAGAPPRPSSSTGALGAPTKKGPKSTKRVRGTGKSVSAPASPSELRSKTTSSLAVQKTSKKTHAATDKRVVSQRESHIWSERERRKGMNYLFSTLRSLLPHPVDKTDKSTVVGEIIKYIQSLQVKLEVMTTKQQVMLATRSGVGGFHSAATVPLPKVLVSNGLTLVDHSSDPTSLTAVTALPPPGKESCLQSFLGTNVGIHVCGRNVFVTTSSPRGRRGLFQELLLTIHKHDLDIINATISTSNASIFHCLHCQASQDAELLNHDLHSALQRVIANYGSQFYKS